MRLVRNLTHCPDAYTHGVVALGNFDGLHLGHQELLHATKSLAMGLDAPAGVLTFSPHPREFFDPMKKPLRIVPLGATLRLLTTEGFDVLYLQRFNAAFATISAEVFIERYLVGYLKVRHIVTGDNFIFGHGRAGNTDLLDQAAKAHGFGFTRIEHVSAPNGGECSSTQIRSFLRKGNVKGASALLGKPYAVEGRVLHGDKRGRSLGFPTLNLSMAARFAPAHGVYTARVMLPDGTCYNGAANIGLRPTFNGEGLRLEVHAFGLDKELYGARVKVELFDFIREDKHFADAASLVAQMKKDCAEAMQILSSRPC